MAETDLSESPDGDIQLVIYPFLKYKDGEYVPYPSVLEDPEKHFQMIREFAARDNDVLVCTSPKSGTHWIFEICGMLLDHTTEYNSRWCCFNIHLEYLGDYNYLESETRRRLFHTHLPFSLIPEEHVKMKNKIVYLNRNPKDRYASMFHFIRGLNGAPNFTWNEYWEKEVINDKLSKGWFTYTKEMEAAVADPSISIHRVLYEELYLNPEKEIKRLAEYLEVPFDDDFIKEVADKCSFDKLKDNQFDATRAMHPDKKSTIFRKGVIGDWKNWFTVAQNEQFDEIYKRKMEGVDVDFIYEHPEK